MLHRTFSCAACGQVQCAWDFSFPQALQGEAAAQFFIETGMLTAHTVDTASSGLQCSISSLHFQSPLGA